MREHHQRVVERLVERFGQDPAFPALIVGGSIAKGWEQEDSDVDIILVATDEEYARRESTHAYHYWTTDLCDYAGGYVDGKIVNCKFLEDVAEYGSEPARAAFTGAFAAYSRLPGLEDLVKRIPVYPEHEQKKRIHTFYAQMVAQQWYVGEAEKRNDRYLLMQAVSDVILYGGRLILAHNKILYPYHKWFLTALSHAPEKPTNLMDLIQQLLADPSKRDADLFCESIVSFTQWDLPPEGWPSRFMKDTEWAWRTGRTAVADL